MATKHFAHRIRKLLIIGSFLLFILISCLIVFNSSYGVLDSPDFYVKKINKECSVVKDKSMCIAFKLEDLTKMKDLKLSKKVLSSLQKMNSRILDCHLAAHLMVGVEVKRNPKKWQEIMENQDPLECMGGFVHGALETHILLRSQDKIDAEVVNEVCGMFKKNEQYNLNCYHVIGHLLLMQHDRNLNESVKLCKDIADNDLSFQCYYGAFMEYNTNASFFSHGATKKLITRYKQQEVLKMEQFCGSLSIEEASLACWTEMGRLYIAENNNFKIAVFQCKSAPTHKAIMACSNFIIGAKVLSSNRLNINQLTNICNAFKTSSEIWKSCIFEVERTLLRSGDIYLRSAIGFCNNIDNSFKNSCLTYVLYNLPVSNTTSKDSNGICREFPEEYYKKCASLTFN